VTGSSGFHRAFWLIDKEINGGCGHDHSCGEVADNLKMLDRVDGAWKA